jgi:putative nucleotidyltransferase with HDIG domain
LEFSPDNGEDDMTEPIEDFKKKLAEIKEISTLPQVMVRMMEIITNENSSAADLAGEISKDASLTGKILKMVNSAYYGFYREIAEVSDAVVILGFNEIRRLSLAISVFDMFEGHRLEFWNHSFACAAMSDILAKERLLQDQGAFTAGLLHDIGKSILDQYFSDMFSAVQNLMQERSICAHEAEMELFGFDHAEIGYWLSERWNLPVTLSEAIRYHHQPEAAEEMPELARIVHLADRLSLEFAEQRGEVDSRGGTLPELEDDLEPEEKVELLSELEERIGDSSLIDIFG